MRKRVQLILAGVILLVCSLALVSCDAIAAQKITNPGIGSFPGGNGGGRNGSPGINGGRGTNGRPEMNGRSDVNGGQSSGSSTNYNKRDLLPYVEVMEDT